MTKPASRWFFAAATTAVVAATALLHACRDQSVEPGAADAAAAARGRGKFTLTLQATGSTASGSLVSSRAGLSCVINYSAGRLTTSGTCSKDIKAEMVLTISASPSSGGPVAWTGCDEGVTDNPLSCQVTMSADRTIRAVFSPPASNFDLTVQGGANGSGTVTSAPTGISCTITDGTASSSCGASYPSGASVTLNATAAAGSYIKAWSGASCDASGTGVSTSTGSCVVTMTQAQGVIVSFQTSADEAKIGSWAPPIAWGAVAIHAHLLPTGKVMTYGRIGNPPIVWDPAVPGAFQNFVAPGDVFCSGHTLLPDGRLLVAGGHSGVDNFGTKTTFIFNASGGWTRVADMRNGRWYPTNLTLPTGDVLTISGGDTAGNRNLIPEVWQNDSWRALSTASRNVPLYPMMFAAPDGRAFMAGPAQATAFLSTDGTGLWAPGPVSGFGARDYGSAVMYEPGKILLVGGGYTTATAEVIDLNAGATWRPVQAMSVARRQHNATLLADGTVLVTGGSNATGFNSAPTDSRVLRAERWDPATETWDTLARMSHHRLYHSTALLLPDGRVLSVGSGQPAAAGLTDDYTAEIFTPPYLYRLDGTLASRPEIAAAPSEVSYGQAFTVQTPAAASIVKATWIRLSSVTHAFNQNQRLNRLTVTPGGTSTVIVNAPASSREAPPGHYMLFLINSSGVPSIARIIRIF